MQNNFVYDFFDNGMYYINAENFSLCLLKIIRRIRTEMLDLILKLDKTCKSFKIFQNMKIFVGENRLFFRAKQTCFTYKIHYNFHRTSRFRKVRIKKPTRPISGRNTAAFRDHVRLRHER